MVPVSNPNDIDAPSRGLCVFFEVVLWLDQVIIPVMVLPPHYLRREVVAVQQRSHILHTTLHFYGFIPTDDFMLRCVVNREGTNKLSQLSISISFTSRIICFGFVPVYVAQGFRIVNRACLPYSLA
jgi:hypothetical protein